MKLSKETIQVLKNFSSINSNLLIKEGNVLSTISVHKNVMAEATLEDSFPQNFGIYDMHEFLGAVNLFDDPDLTFKDKYVLIEQGSSSIKFVAAEPTVLMTPPDRKINFPSSDVSFNMSAAMFLGIIKTASVLRSEDVSIVGDGTKMKVVISDKKNSSANSYSLELGETDLNFKINLKVENLKFMPLDYKVEVSKKKIAKFTSSDSKILYYVAVEADSTFD